MAVIDVQVHGYERNHPGRPWAGHLHGLALATGEEMVAAIDAVGVDCQMGYSAATGRVNSLTASSAV